MIFFAGHPLLMWVVLAGVGALVSFINSISGGGSVLSLPLLVLLGLPASEANGTNRLGIWLGSLGSSVGFWRKGMVYPAMTLRAAVPGAVGSVLGSLVGISLPEALFKPVLAAVILFVVFETLRPKRMPAGVKGSNVEGLFLRSGWIPFLVYMAIGFYGGFLQAGSGLIMMYAFSRLSNLNLIQINVLKVSNTFLFITVSLLIYGWYGKVRWDMAIALALGNALGGFTGSVLQVRKGEGFVRIFFAVSGSALALKLFYDAVYAMARSYF